ncbi:MAG: YwhD family protein [Alicyclobacillus sp.]|nr:YwhD family protein [Alicyclobacillus sp.]
MEKLGLTGRNNHSTDDSMRGLSAVFIDGDNIFIDNGAIHGKSSLERGITFVRSKDELTHPRHIWVVWITLKRNADKAQGYHGAMPFSLWIDDAAKQGYKSLAEQVNKMDKTVKGTVDVVELPPDVRAKLGTFLQSFSDLWQHAQPQFRAAFAQTPEPGAS